MSTTSHRHTDEDSDGDSHTSRSRAYREESDEQREESTETAEKGRSPSRATGVEGATINRSAESEYDGSTGGGDRPDRGRVNYDPGPDVSRLSERYGMTFARDGQAEKIQRIESDFGERRVQRWADEGMTVETMGKPRAMRAFRERQAARPAAIPADVERRNQASVQRNARGTNDEGRPAGDTSAPESVRRVVSSPGASMDETVQREMESKMGGDFSDVQLHTGPSAAAAADSINARAFTVGNHVAFNRGEYQPESSEGKRILAHELTHVRQQTDGRVSLLPKAGTETESQTETSPAHADDSLHVQPKLEVSSPDDPAEREAERVAEQVVSMDETDAPRAAVNGESPGVARSAVYRQESSSVGASQSESSQGESSQGQSSQEQRLRAILDGQDTGTVDSLVRYIQNNGFNMGVFVALGDRLSQVVGTLGALGQMQRVFHWVGVMENLGYSSGAITNVWDAFLTNPPWRANLFLERIGNLDDIYEVFGRLGDAASVVGAAITGWKIGTHLRQGSVSQAFAEAYKGFMGIAVPIGGLIDGCVKLIHFLFGDVPYVGQVADVLKAFNPIELGGIAVDSVISIVHAVIAAFGFGGQTAYQVLVQLESRIEGTAGPIVRFFEVTRIQGALSAGIDTIMTLLDIVIEHDLSMEQIEQLIQRYREYGLGFVVDAGERLGDMAFEATEAASDAWDQAAEAGSDAWESISFW